MLQWLNDSSSALQQGKLRQVSLEKNPLKICLQKCCTKSWKLAKLLAVGGDT